MKKKGVPDPRTNLRAQKKLLSCQHTLENQVATRLKIWLIKRFPPEVMTEGERFGRGGRDKEEEGQAARYSQARKLS